MDNQIKPIKLLDTQSMYEKASGTSADTGPHSAALELFTGAKQPLQKQLNQS
jgi:hypothetical protein